MLNVGDSVVMPNGLIGTIDRLVGVWAYVRSGAGDPIEIRYADLKRAPISPATDRPMTAAEYDALPEDERRKLNRLPPILVSHEYPTMPNLAAAAKRRTVTEQSACPAERAFSIPLYVPEHWQNFGDRRGLTYTARHGAAPGDRDDPRWLIGSTLAHAYVSAPIDPMPAGWIDTPGDTWPGARKDEPFSPSDVRLWEPPRYTFPDPFDYPKRPRIKVEAIDSASAREVPPRWTSEELWKLSADARAAAGPGKAIAIHLPRVVIASAPATGIAAAMIEAAHRSCPDCHGTREYVGFSTREPCRTCCG